MVATFHLAKVETDLAEASGERRRRRNRCLFAAAAVAFNCLVGVIGVIVSSTTPGHTQLFLFLFLLAPSSGVFSLGYLFLSFFFSLSTIEHMLRCLQSAVCHCLPLSATLPYFARISTNFYFYSPRGGHLANGGRGEKLRERERGVHEEW